MKKIKAMIDSAFNKKDAIYMLETLRIFGDISDVEYEKGRKLINKSYKNNQFNQNPFITFTYKIIKTNKI